MNIKDVVDLVAAEVPDPTACIEKVFEWHFDREKAVCQWSLGAAGTLFLAVIVAFLIPQPSTQTQIPVWRPLLAIVFAILASTFGIYRLVRLRSLHRQYISALRLYQDFAAVKPFVLRYRGSSRGN
jgi:hypothetical protein